MKNWKMMDGLALVVALFCLVVGAQGRTVREALESLLATRYCWTATMNGMSLETAIRGETPIAGGGGFNVPEEEWLPVLLEMTAEELEACKRDTVEDIAGIRQREAAGAKRDFDNTSTNEDSRYLWAAYKRVKARASKLMMMVNCLQFAEGETEHVLDMLERVAVECPAECDVSNWVSESLVKKACHGGQFARCLELGRRYRELHGPGCYEEWELCYEFGYYGLPVLEVESDREVGYRYILEFGATLGSLPFARGFDEMALKVISGWNGSLQRRQLAERCLMSAESGETQETPTERVQRICPWAVAELAADESDLTDLREVYGDWAQKAEEE